MDTTMKGYPERKRRLMDSLRGYSRRELAHLVNSNPDCHILVESCLEVLEERGHRYLWMTFLQTRGAEKYVN